jgi:hypothetical protein
MTAKLPTKQFRQEKPVALLLRRHLICPLVPNEVLPSHNCEAKLERRYTEFIAKASSIASADYTSQVSPSLATVNEETGK